MIEGAIHKLTKRVRCYFCYTKSLLKGRFWNLSLVSRIPGVKILELYSCASSVKIALLTCIYFIRLCISYPMEGTVAILCDIHLYKLCFYVYLWISSLCMNTCPLLLASRFHVCFIFVYLWAAALTVVGTLLVLVGWCMFARDKCQRPQNRWVWTNFAKIKPHSLNV